eukprot:scaffold248_cov111-Cylindrotheca_fusiformis.AAC.7
MMGRWFLCLCATLLLHSSLGWFPGPLFGAKKVHRSKVDLSTSRDSTTEADEACESRRRFLSAAAMQICLFGGATVAVAPANAADATVYKSGKTPLAPGTSVRVPMDRMVLQDPRKTAFQNAKTFAVLHTNNGKVYSRDTAPFVLQESLSDGALTIRLQHLQYRTKTLATVSTNEKH